MKPLLIFAHKGEAYHFFKMIHFTPIEYIFKGFFTSDKYFLLLTGEGLFAASEKTVCVLSHYSENISEIYNIGTAGSLNENLNIDQIVWVKTSYAGNTKALEFKSFNTKDLQATFNCISANERITEPEDRKKLSITSDLVDRELWAIGSAATLFSKHFRALKYISDDPKSNNFIPEVIKKAPLISEKLYQEFVNRDSSVR